MSNADKLLKRVEFYEKMASAQKSEAGDLLNKAALFERLALYSDSKSFLKALAQQNDAPNYYQYPEFQETEEFKQSLPRTIPPPEPVKPLTPAQEAQKALQGPADITFKDDKITGFAPIDPKVQEHLSSLVTNRNWGIPLSPVNGKTPFDGRIGKDTRRALDTFKSRMGLPANTPDSQLFQKIESEYAKDNPASYDFSSQLQQQEHNRVRESTPPGIGVNAPKKT